MRRIPLFFSLLLLLSGCTVSVARIGLPFDNTLLQAGVGIKLLPKSDAFTLLRISPLWLGDDFVAAGNLSLVSASETNAGLALGGVLLAEDGFGLSVAAVDRNKAHIGVRAGGIVCGGRQHGVQIGLVTSCSADSRALQIGLLNFVEGAAWPRPLLNVVLPADDDADDES